MRECVSAFASMAVDRRTSKLEIRPAAAMPAVRRGAVCGADRIVSLLSAAARVGLHDTFMVAVPSCPRVPHRLHCVAHLVCAATLQHSDGCLVQPCLVCCSQTLRAHAALWCLCIMAAAGKRLQHAVIA